MDKAGERERLRGVRERRELAKPRPLQRGDTVYRVGWPLEDGTVIVSLKFTVKVLWPGGQVEEIDRGQLLRRGDPLKAEFDGVLRDQRRGTEGANFPTVGGYNGFTNGKKYTKQGYTPESEE